MTKPMPTTSCGLCKQRWSEGDAWGNYLIPRNDCGNPYTETVCAHEMCATAVLTAENELPFWADFFSRNPNVCGFVEGQG